MGFWAATHPPTLSALRVRPFHGPSLHKGCRIELCCHANYPPPLNDWMEGGHETASGGLAQSSPMSPPLWRVQLLVPSPMSLVPNNPPPHHSR